MRLYMVRHGETDWNKAKKVQGESRYSSQCIWKRTGRKDSRRTAGDFFDLAYTSPLSRAKRNSTDCFAGGERSLIEEPQIQERFVLW